MEETSNLFCYGLDHHFCILRFWEMSSSGGPPITRCTFFFVIFCTNQSKALNFMIFMLCKCITIWCTIGNCVCARLHPPLSFYYAVKKKKLHICGVLLQLSLYCFSSAMMFLSSTYSPTGCRLGSKVAPGFPAHNSVDANILGKFWPQYCMQSAPCINFKYYSPRGPEKFWFCSDLCELPLQKSVLS